LRPKGDIQGYKNLDQVRNRRRPLVIRGRKEEGLNQGMGYLSGLMEMATGQKLMAAEGSQKMVHLDQKTGDVTLEFTLPGFTQKSVPRTRVDS
jgi:hypothetical protein